MRLYVNCREHPQERIYIQFPGREPQEKRDIPLPLFCARCSITENYSSYTSSDVMAEEGAQLPVLGAGLGALLFFINPIAGAFGTILGLAGGKRSEEEKVGRFNQSRV